MQIEILEKYRSDTFEDFTLRVNKRIDSLNRNYNVVHIKIQPYKDYLICFLIYKPLI
jgi:hypothetical protein